MPKKSLDGKIALVTGATRGIGKGTAIQLAQAGALVYITGRTLKSNNNLGSLEDTAHEIKSRGGRCIPVRVDHERDEEIRALFDKIEKEQNGQLDILVNNAYKGVSSVFNNLEINFWETSPEIWDEINNVGLRNHYICTVYASRMMVKQKSGLIVNVSSAGGMKYIFNVPYGVGKAACDRMAVDCGIELKKQNVAMVSLWPGGVKTEMLHHLNDELKGEQATSFKQQIDLNSAESIEFSGKIIASLASDPKIMNYTSRVIISADYARDHGITDIDGRQIPSYRQLNFVASIFLPNSLKFIANFIPNFIKVPFFLINIYNSKYY